MSTIAYRNGIMAADSRAYSGDREPFGNKNKLRWHNGILVACSSASVGVPDAVATWFCETEGKDVAALKDKLVLVREPGFTLLCVYPNGDAMLMTGEGLPSIAHAPFYSIGSGDAYAKGAMARGASAEEAIEVACQFDVYSGLPVRTLMHKGGPLREVKPSIVGGAAL